MLTKKILDTIINIEGDESDTADDLMGKLIIYHRI